MGMVDCTDVSEEPAPIVFRVKGRGRMFLQDAGIHFWNNKIPLVNKKQLSQL
jgi:hypothetical protein